MTYGKILLIVCLLMASFVFAKVISNKAGKKSEEKNYTVESSNDKFEIRNYGTSIVASVELGNGSYDDNSSRGFRKLAGYIFGGNNESQQIAMTSPVMMELGDSSTMHFFMPNGYDLDNLPTPNNQEVQLDEIQPKRVAVIKFGGWASQTRIDKYQSKLVASLKEEGIAHTDNFFFLGYNAPYEVVNRKNEVMVELKD
ncbi:heme-binding protein [Crocinitomicaceae bacterium]|nr:heme-binding protein [Crocinitomicaceae bacterium]MDB3906414.1 heme-binding protein [Crocinitomicaceae bacterium]